MGIVEENYPSKYLGTKACCEEAIVLYIWDKLKRGNGFQGWNAGNFVKDKGASYADSKQLKVYSLAVRREFLCLSSKSVKEIV